MKHHSLWNNLLNKRNKTVMQLQAYLVEICNYSPCYSYLAVLSIVKECAQAAPGGGGTLSNEDSVLC